jgi:chromatin segregation and condensation protein Rec8/ScpA/Scc1 (kleisin family)
VELADEEEEEIPHTVVMQEPEAVVMQTAEPIVQPEPEPAPQPEVSAEPVITPAPQESEAETRAKARAEALARLRAEQAQREAARAQAQPEPAAKPAEPAPQPVPKTQQRPSAQGGSSTAQDVLARIETISREGAPIATMKEVALQLQRERGKPENNSPELQQKFKEALSTLLKAMSTANKK